MIPIPEFAAHVTTDIDGITSEQLDDLVGALAGVAGVPAMLGGQLSVQLTVEAEASHADLLATALMTAQAATVDALRRAGIADNGDRYVVGVEVLTAEEFERREARPTAAVHL